MANLIKEKDTPFGKLYIVYEANGGMRTFSTREEAEAYKPNTKDSADNAANDLVFTALTLGATNVGKAVGKAVYEGGKKALLVAGLAMTPSTWIGGISRMAGYEAPTALLNGADLAYSAYLGKQAGDAIEKEGLNLKTGIEAALSLAPFTRSEEAIKAVAGLPRTIKDIKDSSNVVNKARLAYEMNKGVKGALFVNVPIEHVSPNGITKGATLDVGAEGIHFSPAGSSTTPTILKTMGYPYVRTGTWTYTNNTLPVNVTDVGLFRRGYNPDFDNKVDNGFFNFVYRNNFEGLGNTSYLTTEPSWGFLLSKNIKAPEDSWLTTPAVSISAKKHMLKDGTMTPKIHGFFDGPYPNLMNYFLKYETGVKTINGKLYDTITFLQNGVPFEIGRFAGDNKIYVSINNDSPKVFNNSDPSAIENYVLDMRNKLINLLSKESLIAIRLSKILPDRTDLNGRIITGTSLGDTFKESIKNDISDFYLSEDYLDKFAKAFNQTYGTNHTSESISTPVKTSLYKTHDLTDPILFKDENEVGLMGASTWDDTYSGTNGRPLYLLFGLNGYGDLGGLYKWDSVLFHEFGHNIWRDNTILSKFIRDWNTNITKDRHNNVLPSFTKKNPPSSENYDYLTDPNEVRLRIMTAVRDNYKEGITDIDEIFKSEAMDFSGLKEVFNPKYLKYLLGSMLSLIGVVPMINNSKT